MDDIFAPADTQIAAHSSEDTEGFGAPVQSLTDPFEDFSMFCFALTDNPHIAKMFEKKATMATLKFRDLLDADRTTDKRLTQLLHEMTKDLHSLYNKNIVKGKTKARMATKKLSYWFNDIRLLDLDQGAVIALSTLRENLESVMRPAMRASGLWEQFRALPWATISTGTATAAIMFWAFRSNLVQNLINAFGSFTDAINHLKQSEQEANRNRAAFYKEVEIDDEATAENEESEDPSIKGRIEYVSITDFQTKRTWYLKKYPELRPADPAEFPLWNTNRRAWIRERKMDFREKRSGWEKNWSTARPGIMERMVEALMEYVPMVKELSKQLVQNAHVQQQWFEAHHIGKNRYMAATLVGKVRPSETPTPSDFSMRYISDRVLAPEEVQRHVQQYGKTKYLGRTAIPFLWRDPKGSFSDEYSGWQYTFLPQRNIAERLIETLRATNNPDTPLGRLIEGVGLQLQTTNRNFDLWFEAIQATEDLRDEREKAMWEKVKHGDNQADILKYRPRYRTRFEGVDLRTEAERAADESPRYSDQKRMYYVGRAPGIPHTNEAGEHLRDKDTGRPLYRHYPDISVLEKLTKSINGLNDLKNPGARMVDAIAGALRFSNSDYAEWLEKEGFATIDEYGTARLHADVRRLVDEKEKPYLIHVDVDGNPTTERVYERPSAINGLWNALNALVHDPEAGISTLVRSIADVTGDVTSDDSKLVATVDRLVANALERLSNKVDLHVPGGGLRNQLGNLRLRWRTTPGAPVTNTEGPLPQAPEPEDVAQQAEKEIEGITQALKPLESELAELEKQRIRWYKVHKRKTPAREGATRRYHEVAGEISNLKQRRQDAAFRLQQAEMLTLKKKDPLNEANHSVVDAESVAGPLPPAEM